MATVKGTSKNFEKEVLGGGKVIVDFYADWCGPCKMLAPTMEEIANEYPDIKVVKVNVDEERDLAYKFQIMSIPTVIGFVDGKENKKMIGFKSKNFILDLVK